MPQDPTQTNWRLDIDIIDGFPKLVPFERNTQDQRAAISAYTFKGTIPGKPDIGIDWSTDTYDAGLHLNVYGAEKLSEYFGQILADRHGISDRRGDSTLLAQWQGRVDKYYEDKKIMESK